MPKSNPTREQADLQHLARIRGLIEEVAAAISAIERNDLPGLQSAVAKQERTSHELAATKWIPAPRLKKANAASGSGEQIQEAYVALAQINRVYAAVLKRSKRSVALLSALYGMYGDGYRTDPSGNSQMLSCEV
jgi:hypothetical protein